MLKIMNTWRNAEKKKEGNLSKVSWEERRKEGRLERTEKEKEIEIKDTITVTTTKENLEN